VPPGTPSLIAAAMPFLPPNYTCWDFDPVWNLTPDFPEQAGVPVGRYAVNVINANEQVWTVPNELANVPNAMCPPDGCHAPSQSIVIRFTEAVAPSGFAVCPNPPQRGFPTQPMMP
jgi:hypothetical protein